MNTSEETLKSIHATKILDVATGRGDFLSLLEQLLGTFGSAVGIDIKKSEVWQSEEVRSKPIEFLEMDAAELKFADNSFDLVSISNSLHHLPDPQKALAEMTRVLKPGGHLIVYEMYTDGQTPAQQTHTMLHQWWGKIDSEAGVFHASPYTRAELIKKLKVTGIEAWEYFDEADLSSDPLEPALVEEIGKIIDSYQKRAKKQEFIDEGEELRKRVKSVGFHSATQLLAIGKMA